MAFILFYLKVCPTFDVQGVFRGINGPECCRWVCKLLPLLEELPGQKQLLPKRRIASVAQFAAAFPQAAEVGWSDLCGGIKKSAQRKHCPGKKKRRTRKAIVIVDGKRRIGYLSVSKKGARHDKRLLDQQQVMPNMPANVSVLADSGFQGLRHPGMCLPQKGTKRRELDGEQKQWNRLLSGLRVVVEHGIGVMKRYAAVSEVHRDRLPRTDDRFNVLAAGLRNLFIA